MHSKYNNSEDDWGTLSLKERAAIIKTGVKNGLTDIEDIKSAYREFAGGGDLDDEDKIDFKFTAPTGEAPDFSLPEEEETPKSPTITNDSRVPVAGFDVMDKDTQDIKLKLAYGQARLDTYNWLKGRKEQLQTAADMYRQNHSLKAPLSINMEDPISVGKAKEYYAVKDGEALKRTLINNMKNTSYDVDAMPVEDSQGDYRNFGNGFVYRPKSGEKGRIRALRNDVGEDYLRNGYSTTLRHETTHSLLGTPINEQISEIIKDKALQTRHDKQWTKYYLSPDEVWARMMQYRQENNLKPSDVITPETLNRNSLRRFNLDFDDDTIIRLLNEVAYNPNKNQGLFQDNVQPNYAAYGGNMFAAGGGAYMQAASTAMGLAENAINQANNVTTAKSAAPGIQSVGSQFGANHQYNDFDSLMEAGTQMKTLNSVKAGDLRNNSFWADFGNSVSASAQGASAGQAFGPWGAAIGGIVGGASSVIGSLFGRAKARREAKKINSMVADANMRQRLDYNNQMNNIALEQANNIAANYAAYGGHIYEGTTENTQQMYTRANNGNPIKFDENGNLVDQVTGETGSMILPDLIVNGRDFTKPYNSAYSDELKTLLLHGIPQSASWILGNTVGKAIDFVPGASEGLSLITPSRWAGTIGAGLNGEAVAPWSENNQGWSTLIGDEYGEAADFYGDLFLGSKLKKLPRLKKLNIGERFKNDYGLKTSDFHNWGSESMTGIAGDKVIKVSKKGYSKWRMPFEISKKLDSNKVDGHVPYTYEGFIVDNNGKYRTVFSQDKVDVGKGVVSDAEFKSLMKKANNSDIVKKGVYNIEDVSTENGLNHNIGKQNGVPVIYDAMLGQGITYPLYFMTNVVPQYVGISENAAAPLVGAGLLPSQGKQKALGGNLFAPEGPLGQNEDKDISTMSEEEARNSDYKTYAAWRRLHQPVNYAARNKKMHEETVKKAGGFDAYKKKEQEREAKALERYNRNSERIAKRQSKIDSAVNRAYAVQEGLNDVVRGQKIMSEGVAQTYQQLAKEQAQRQHDTVRNWKAAIVGIGLLSTGGAWGANSLFRGTGTAFDTAMNIGRYSLQGINTAKDLGEFGYQALNGNMDWGNLYQGLSGLGAIVGYTNYYQGKPIIKFTHNGRTYRYGDLDAAMDFNGILADNYGIYEDGTNLYEALTE